MKLLTITLDSTFINIKVIFPHIKVPINLKNNSLEFESQRFMKWLQSWKKHISINREAIERIIPKRLNPLMILVQSKNMKIYSYSIQVYCTVYIRVAY